MSVLILIAFVFKPKIFKKIICLTSLIVLIVINLTDHSRKLKNILKIFEKHDLQTFVNKGSK